MLPLLNNVVKNTMATAAKFNVTKGETMQTQYKGYNFNLYQKGHIVLAAIRIFEFNNEYAPDIENLHKMLNCVSLEDLTFVVRRLENLGILNIVSAAGARRIFINDHLKLEELKNQPAASSLEDEVAKFKEEQNKIGAKVTQMQQEQKERKKDLYADMEKKLKAELAKREKNEN